MARVCPTVPRIHCLTFGVLFLSLVQALTAEFVFYNKPFQIKSVPYGDNFAINCSTNGTNVTTSLLRQYSGGWVPLPNPSLKDIVLIKEGDVYTLLDFGLPDSGNYKCSAKDGISGQTIQWPSGGFLIPNDNKMPEMSVSPNINVVVLKGESTNFTCQSVSKVSLTWYKMDIVTKTDIPVPVSKIAILETVKAKKVILMIKNAQKSETGNYKCVLQFRGKDRFEMAALTVLETKAPQIISHTSTINTRDDQVVSMECIVKGHPEPQVKWYKGNKEIKACIIVDKLISNNCNNAKYIARKETIIRYDRYNSTLKIIEVKYPKDHGKYHCKASQRAGVAKADIFVNIQVKPSIVKGDESVLEGKNVPTKIYCQVIKSNPIPTWTWQFQERVCLAGKLCAPDPLNWVTLIKPHTVVPMPGTPSNRSTINIPSKQDSAFYRCIATNPLGSANLTKMLLRNDNKEVLKIEGSKVVHTYTEGINPIIIKCDVIKQFGNFGVVWYIGDKSILPDTERRITVERTNSSDPVYDRFVFTLVNITANDTGTYTCATYLNKNKNKTIKFIVKALVKPNIKGLISQDIKEESNVFVELKCDTLDANPKAKVTWYKASSKDSKDSEDINKKIQEGLESTAGCDSRTPGYYFLQGQKGAPLIICKPKHPIHTAWYTCVAENIAGSDSQSAQINIFAKATITNPTSNKELKESLGSSFNITCTATGNPVPSVVWTKTGSREILVSGIGTARLQFKDLLKKNLGNYTCNATNYMSHVLRFSISEMNPDINTQASKEGISNQALIGIICGCIAFVLLVSIICLVVYRRQKKQIEEYKELYFLRTGNSDYKIDPDRSLLDQCNDLPYDLDWEFPEERLILGKPLGAGAFGQVVKAQAIGMAAFKPRDKTPEAVKNRSKLRRSMRESKKKNEYTSMRLSKTTVAVKTLKEGATQNDYKDLASELKILIHLGNNRNIVNILGACTRGRRLMVIIEFAPHGDLLSFLRERRDIYEPNWVKTSNNPDQEFTLVDLGMATYQISRGMEFLASRKCVHRDLAARNVLVGQDYVMKISDFGLARDIYKDDLYVKTTSGLLPVKWMAMESLFDRVYTEKSDVWSFGIVLWEIFTLGGNPYPGLPTEQLLDYLSEGQRMKQPQNCPLEMYAIMRDCWMQFPDQRPEFRSIAERLGQILERNVSEDNPYIHLEMDEQTGVTDYYLNPCDAFNTQGRQTADGYEEALPTPRPETSKYDSPLPTLPPPDSPGYDAPTEPLPAIPPTYEEATQKRRHDDARKPSQSSNESGIGIDEKEKEREETEPLIVRLEDETRVSPDKKGKRSTESTV